MTTESTLQEKTSRPWIRWLLISIGVLFLVIWLYSEYERSGNWIDFTHWLNFTDKSFWDWLEILLVPALLLFVGESLRHAEHNRQESEKQHEQKRQAFEEREARRRDEERYREETVRKYFDDMAYLMVEKDLLELVQSVEPEKLETDEETEDAAPPGPDPEKPAELLKNPVWRMAQTRTITVLRRMAYQRIVDNDSSSESTVDVQRVNEILDFLRDTKLITGIASLLYNANLRNINLQGADLRGVNLSHSALDRADLSGAQLQAANLSNVEMRSANLSHAVCSETNLYNAHLSSAHLIGANLGKANMRGAILFLTKLMHANLSHADLVNAKLDSAHLNNADLSHADLSGAILAMAKMSGAKIKDTKFDEKTVLPEIPKMDKNGQPIYTAFYDTNRGPEQMDRYINSKSDEEQANINNEDTK
ncbi:MAG: hypothetical protein CL607_06455 [Anaerolineaceae bacterium]|nr:hypothetical protein [Anaerolineaceae bacterium]